MNQILFQEDYDCFVVIFLGRKYVNIIAARHDCSPKRICLRRSFIIDDKCRNLVTILEFIFQQVILLLSVPWDEFKSKKTYVLLAIYDCVVKNFENGELFHTGALTYEPAKKIKLFEETKTLLNSECKVLVLRVG